MINLDAINKNNLVKEPFEYMCIDFIDTNFVKEYKLINNNNKIGKHNIFL